MSYDYLATMQSDDHTLSALELVARYEQGITDLRTAVDGLTDWQARLRPIEGKWSTLEVVAHLTGSEIYFTDRIERTLAMDRPLLMGVDERFYPERLSYQELDINEQLDLFSSLRKHLSRILRKQPGEAWRRCAVHSEMGIVTLRQLVWQPTRHLQHHLRFIAEKKTALLGTSQSP